MMNNIPEFIDRTGLENIAAGGGVAIAVVDESGEIFVANNNSICATLNPSGRFSPACSEYCGKALEKAREANRGVGYECHAGLACRAVKIGTAEKPLVAIVGRSFLGAESYRDATTRAISGDWSQYSPSEFFENILLSGSEAVLDKAVSAVEKLAPVKSINTAKLPGPVEPARDITTLEAVPVPNQVKEIVDHQRADQRHVSERLTGLVERFNRDVGLGKRAIPGPEPKLDRSVQAVPEPEQTEEVLPGDDRTARASAWRSFFGSILKSDYAGAADSILEFLAEQHGFSSLMWLDRQNGKLAVMTAFGELKNRNARLGIAADDERLVAALHSEMPFELAERAKGATGSRTMHLFPIGIADDISAAIAVLDPLNNDEVKKQIARTALSIAPQIEILRLRSALLTGETLSAAVRRFSDSLKLIDSDDLWLRLTQNAAEMLKAERASLLTYDEKADSLALKAIIGSKSAPEVDEEVGGRVSKYVYAKSSPIAVADVRKTGLLPAPDDRQYRSSSFLSCPILIAGRTIGVMNFTDRACGLAFDKSSLEMYLAIAPQLAVAVDRALLKDKAGEFEQLSVTDSLTGLLNRRYIEARLAEEIKRSTRHGFPMSFMMLDVDRFKSYNDAYGHPAGDVALKLVAHVVRETLRGADVAARFGGEEFAILLPQTTGEEAAAIAERIRVNIEQADFPHRPVTASIGIASCSADLCVSTDLVDAADQALYESKRRGRNQVLAFEEIAA